MKKVFIPSLPTRYDAATDSRVPSLDLNPAAQFGELVNMSSDPIRHGHFAIHIEEIQRMIEHEAEKDDLILCVGDVILTAAALSYFNKKHGKVNALRWDKKRRSYTIEEVVM